MWIARNALLVSGTPPGTINAGLSGVLVSTGITDHEFTSILGEYNSYGSLMEKAYERVNNDDV